MFIHTCKLLKNVGLILVTLLILTGTTSPVQAGPAPVAPMPAVTQAHGIRQERIVEAELVVRGQADVTLLRGLGYACGVGVCKLELRDGEEIRLGQLGLSVRVLGRAIKISGQAEVSGDSAMRLGEQYVFGEDYVDHSIPDGNFPSGCGPAVMPGFEVTGAPADATITRVVYTVKIDHPQATEVYARLGWWHGADSSYLTVWDRSTESMDDDPESDADIELRSRETNFYNGRLVNSTWQLAVQDCGWNMVTGHVDYWKVYVYYWVCEVGTPAAPFPANGADNQSLNVDLDWADTPGANSYDVYFGTTASPPWLAYTISSSYSLPALAYNTTYYWQIEARTACGSVAKGPVWYFRTPHVPGVPSNPSPADGATNQSINVDLGWTWQPPPASSFDVYFGAGLGRPLPWLGSTIYTVYSLGELGCGTHYYWRVVAKNEAGSTSSPEWDFTTQSAGCIRKIYLPLTPR